MSLTLIRFFFLTLALLSAPTLAITSKQLINLRDTAAAETCSATGDASHGPITQAQLDNDARLYLMSCRTTFTDVLSVVILERLSKLTGLVFPEPGIDSSEAWEDARMSRIGVTTLLHSPFVTSTGELASTARIAPGLGSGHILRLYAFDDGSPVLKRFAIELDGSKPINLWQAP